MQEAQNIPYIFFERGVANPALQKFLEITGMPSNLTKIAEINAWAQANILRTGERWTPQEKEEYFEGLRLKLLPLLKDMGFTESPPTTRVNYSAALIHGATLSCVRQRLQHLINLWQEGIRFNQVVFLSGARALEERELNLQALTTVPANSAFRIRADWQASETLPKNEAEMTKWVWEQAELPPLMAQKEVHFIHAQALNAPRPTTVDTVKAWIATHPLPGTYLAISNVPYHIRQDYIARTIAGPRYKFDTIGEKSTLKMFIAADEVARTINEIHGTIL